jgi:putative endonuclease
MLNDNSENNKMKQYYTYIVQCADDSYYTGVTNNLENRIAEHNEGKDVRSYTFSRRPIELVWSNMTFDIKQAIEKEKQIKGWSRVKKEALIKEDWKRIVELSNKKSEKK